MLLTVTLALTAPIPHKPTALPANRHNGSLQSGTAVLQLRGGLTSEHVASEAMRTWAADDVGEAERTASIVQPTTRSLGEDQSRPSLTLRPPPSFTIDKLPTIDKLHRLRGGQSSGARLDGRPKVPLLRRVAQALAGDRAPDPTQEYLHPTTLVLVDPSSDPHGEAMAEAERVGR